MIIWAFLACRYYVFALIFGSITLVLSQLPNMDSLWWVSAIGAIMSICGESSCKLAVGVVQRQGSSQTFLPPGTFVIQASLLQPLFPPLLPACGVRAGAAQHSLHVG